MKDIIPRISIFFYCGKLLFVFGALTCLPANAGNAWAAPESATECEIGPGPDAAGEVKIEEPLDSVQGNAQCDTGTDTNASTGSEAVQPRADAPASEKSCSDRKADCATKPASGGSPSLTDVKDEPGKDNPEAAPPSDVELAEENSTDTFPVSTGPAGDCTAPGTNCLTGTASESLEPPPAGDCAAPGTNCLTGSAPEGLEPPADPVTDEEPGTALPPAQETEAEAISTDSPAAETGFPVLETVPPGQVENGNSTGQHPGEEPGNSYVAAVIPEDGAVNIGEPTSFILTFTELGSAQADTIGTARLEIPASLEGVYLDRSTINASHDKAWDGHVEAGENGTWLIYLYALEAASANYLRRNETVSAQFIASAYQEQTHHFLTAAWRESGGPQIDSQPYDTSSLTPNNRHADHGDPKVNVWVDQATGGYSSGYEAGNRKNDIPCREAAQEHTGNLYAGLDNVRENIYWHYVQTEQIDFKTELGHTDTEWWHAWNEGRGWYAIDAFRGAYHGNNKTIDNLYMNPGAGLFALNSGLIRGITLNNVTVTGNTHSSATCYSGALVGENRGIIDDCHVNGLIIGGEARSTTGGLAGYNRLNAIISNSTANMMVTGKTQHSSESSGGLVGYNMGIIYGSSSSGSVSGSYRVGGLVGANEGSGAILERCNSSAEVLATGPAGDNIGGLVGWNVWDTRIIECFSIGCVKREAGTVSRYVGGLVGSSAQSSVITRSYSSSSVSGSSVVGGLVGRNLWGGIISDCYATGNVSGGSGLVGLQQTDSTTGAPVSTIERCYAVGLVSNAGLVGANDTRSIVQDSYFDSQTTGKTAPPGMARTTGQMFQQSTYLNYCISGTAAYNPAGPSSTWYIHEGKAYPKLFWQYSILNVKMNSDHSKIYGESDPCFVVYYEGFRAGDCASLLEGTLIFERDPGEDVGTYHVYPSGQTAACNTYLLAYNPGTMTIKQRSLTLCGVLTVSDKAYDGTTAAVVCGDMLNLVNLAEGETMGLQGLAAVFDSADAKEKITVRITAAELNDGDGFCASADNYSLSLEGAPSAVANITPRRLTIGGTFSIPGSKIYDGKTAIEILGHNLYLQGILEGETVNLNPLAHFADSKPGENKPVSLTGSWLDNPNYCLDLTCAPQSSACIIIPASPGPVKPVYGSIGPTTAQQLKDNRRFPKTGRTLEAIIAVSPLSGKTYYLVIPSGEERVPLSRPLVTTALVTAGKEAELEMVISRFEEFSRQYAAVRDLSPAPELGRAKIDLAVAWAAIMVRKTALNRDHGTQPDLEAALAAYQAALRSLAKHGQHLNQFQFDRVTLILEVIAEQLFLWGKLP